MKRFSCFIGIDQTGAAIRGGEAAKPLPTAVLWLSDGSWRLKTAFLPSLRPGELEVILPPEIRLRDCALIVDCVFGFPGVVKMMSVPDFWREFRRATTLPYGMKHSERFFSSIFQSRGELPRRECELLAGANSLFQIRPYQRNIQTGTFRIWKDLGLEGKPWLNLWPFERRPRADRPWIFEAFPSLFWRELLGSRVRAPQNLRKLLSKRTRFSCRNWNVIQNDSDIADAVVLATGALMLQERRELFGEPTSRMRQEGWILGVRSRSIHRKSDKRNQRLGNWRKTTFSRHFSQTAAEAPDSLHYAREKAEK